jgi:hypothetical protein
VHFLIQVDKSEASSPDLNLWYNNGRLDISPDSTGTFDITGEDLTKLYEAYKSDKNLNEVTLAVPPFGTGYYDIASQMTQPNEDGRTAMIVYPHQELQVTAVVSGFVSVPSITQTDPTAPIFQLTNNRVNMSLEANIQLRDTDGSESMSIQITLPNFNFQSLPSGTSPDIQVGAPWTFDAKTGVATREFTGAEIKEAKGDFSNLPIPISFNAAALQYLQAGTLSPQMSITVVDHGSPNHIDVTETTKFSLKVTVSDLDLKPHLSELTQEITPEHPFDPTAALENNQAISIDITQALQALEKTFNSLMKQANLHGYGDFPADVDNTVLADAIKVDLFGNASIQAEFFASYPQGAMPMIYGGGAVVGVCESDALVSKNSTSRQIIEKITADTLQNLYEAWEADKSNPDNSKLLITSAPGLSTDFSVKVLSTVPLESTTNELNQALGTQNLLARQSYIVDASAMVPVIEANPHMSIMINPVDPIDASKRLEGTFAKINFSVDAHFPNAHGEEDSKITITLDPTQFVYPPGYTIDGKAVGGEPIANMTDFNAVIGNYFPQESDGWLNAGGLTFIKTLPANTLSDITTEFYIQVPIGVLPPLTATSLETDGLSFADNLKLSVEATTTEKINDAEYNREDNTKSTRVEATFGEQVVEIKQSNVQLSQGTGIADSVEAQAALGKTLADNVKSGNLASISIKEALDALEGQDLNNAKIIIHFKNIDLNNPPDLFFNELGDNFTKEVSTTTKDGVTTITGVTYLLSGNALQTAWVQYHDGKYTDATGKEHTVTLDPHIYLQSHSGNDFLVSATTTGDNGKAVYVSSDTQVVVDASATLPDMDVQSHMSIVVNPTSFADNRISLTGTYSDIYFDVKAKFPNANGTEDSNITLTLDPKQFVYPPGHTHAGESITNVDDFKSLVGTYLPKDSGWINTEGLTFVKNFTENKESDISAPFHMRVPIALLPSLQATSDTADGNTLTNNIKIEVTASTTGHNDLPWETAGFSEGAQLNLNDDTKSVTKDTTVHETVIKLNNYAVEWQKIDSLDAQVNSGNVVKMSLSDAFSALKGQDLNDPDATLTLSFKNVPVNNLPSIYSPDFQFNSIFVKKESGDTVTYTVSGTSLKDIQGKDIYFNSKSGDDFLTSVTATGADGKTVYTSSDTRIIAAVTDALGIGSSVVPSIIHNYIPKDASGKYVAGSMADTYAVDKVDIPIKLNFSDLSSSAKRFVTIELPHGAQYNWAEAIVLNSTTNKMVDGLNGWTLHKGLNNLPDTLTKEFDGTQGGVITESVSLTFNKSVYAEITDWKSGQFKEPIKVYARSYSVIDAIPAGDDAYKPLNDASGLPIVALQGNDITLFSPTSFVSGGTQTDTGDSENIDIITAKKDNTVVQSGQGNDTVIGSAYKDSLLENNSNSGGKDFLVGGKGHDMIQSGSGDDILYATGTTIKDLSPDKGETFNIWTGATKRDIVNVALLESEDKWDSNKNAHATNDFTSSVRDMRSVTLTDTLVGGSGNDIINTQNPNNAAKSGSLVLAGTGNDTVVSGWGSDIVFLNNANSMVVSTIPRLIGPEGNVIKTNSIHYIGEYNDHTYNIAKKLITNVEKMSTEDGNVWSEYSGWNQTDSYVQSFMNFEKKFSFGLRDYFDVKDETLQKELFTQKIAYLIKLMDTFDDLVRMNRVTSIVIGDAYYDPNISGINEISAQLNFFTQTNSPNVTSIKNDLNDAKTEGDVTEYKFLNDNSLDGEYRIGLPSSLLGLANEEYNYYKKLTYDTTLDNFDAATQDSISTGISSHLLISDSALRNPNIKVDTTYNFVYNDNAMSGLYGNLTPNATKAAGMDTLVYTAQSVIHPDDHSGTSDSQHGQSIDTVYYFNYTGLQDSNNNNISHIDASGLLDDLGFSGDRTSSMVTFQTVNLNGSLEPSISKAVQVGLDLKSNQIDMADTHVKDLIDTGVKNGNITENKVDGAVTGYHVALVNLAGFTDASAVQAHQNDIIVLQHQSP